MSVELAAVKGSDFAGTAHHDGLVTNRAGDVIIEAQAAPAVLEEFVAQLGAGPANARVDRVGREPIAAQDDAARLEIITSEHDGMAASIAPDLATCAACVDEITRADGRRAGYAFTSCAACGPRLSIVTSAPYDRERTTMAGFAMCAACRSEYADVEDRRFHAQSIACPACGPTLVLDGGAAEPITRAARALADGAIVAIKGLGGYHLACDATSEDAVATLRRRKHRDAKPFAVMVVDVDAARALAVLDAAAVALLCEPARPIVLAERRPGAGLAPSVAPDVGDLGLMLPYTPLHHLLLRAVGGRPLVMTSGNVSDEPIAFRDAEAASKLGPIADHFLAHDREIYVRCEDSVARVLDGAPAILRRARGYAPAPISLDVALSAPTLALGGQRKAAFALGDGPTAFVSPHQGDLDHLAAYTSFVATLDHLATVHGIAATRVVHDLHPDYATTRLAERLRLPRIAVQHHHAHFASGHADAGLAGPAIGVIFDGAGLGDDATIWGGEVFVGDRARVDRVAHLRDVPLPGGDRTAAEPWRMAIAHLLDAGEPIDAVVARVGPNARVVAAMCEHAPRTSSAGRLFDAVAAIAGLGGATTYEAQTAMQFEALARTVDARSAGSYPVDLTAGLLDTRPLLRGAARDARTGASAATIARKFHTAVVDLVATLTRTLAREHGVRDVVLAGGVFQNRILADEVPARLRLEGLRPHLPRRVPANDGGLAFGQLAIVAARDAIERGGV